MSDKKIRTLDLALDPYENAIVVTYESIVTDSVTGQTETTQKETKVRLKTIKPDSNLQKLAKDIIAKCKYINEKKLPIVEQLVFDLKRRQFQDDNLADEAKDDAESASMSKVDDYMEQLYGGEDDIPEKVKGSRNILELCNNVGNLESLIQNMQLMSALSRVLSDDFKRSTELSFNLSRIFLAFSNFMEMHSILSTYRVGAMTMKVVELELIRSAHRAEENAKSASEGGAVQKESEKDRIVARRQDKLLFVTLHVLINLAEDVSVEKKMVKKNLVLLLSQALDRKTPDTLMLILTFLRKLSIFEDNMRDMISPEVDTIRHLAKLIPCSHDKITTAALRLLFNLSFNKACRERMVQVGLLPKLVELLKKAPFRAKTIRLLYHLSVDDSTKFLFSKTDAIPIIMQLVINFPQNIVAKELAALAVNLSLDAACAEQITDHRGLQHLLNRVSEFGDTLLAKVVRNVSQWTFSEQRAIANIASSVDAIKAQRQRKKEAAGGGAAAEEKDAAGDYDDDLPKVPAYAQRRLWEKEVPTLLKLAVGCDTHDLLVELLGTVGNMTQEDMAKGTKWSSLMKEYNLCSYLGKLLVPGMSQNDVVLECVILVGQICVDEKSSMMIASSSLIRALHELWQDKSDDSEIVLQLLTTFYRMLHFPQTREELLYSTEAMADISDCIGSKHRATRIIAEKCLDIILEQDRTPDGEIGELGAQVRRRRFLAHNKEWIETVSADGRQDRVFRHVSSDDDLLGDDDGVDWNRHDGRGDYDDDNDRDHFITGSGQKVGIRGVDDSTGSREFDGGWGQ